MYKGNVNRQENKIKQMVCDVSFLGYLLTTPILIIFVLLCNCLSIDCLLLFLHFSDYTLLVSIE